MSDRTVAYLNTDTLARLSPFRDLVVIEDTRSLPAQITVVMVMTVSEMDRLAAWWESVKPAVNRD